MLDLWWIKWNFGGFFCSVLHIHSVSITGLMLYTHLHQHVALARGTINGVKAGSLPKSNVVSETGDPCKAKNFHFIFQRTKPALSIWSLTFEKLNVICFI